jgi:CBS domain-containing protein
MDEVLPRRSGTMAVLKDLLRVKGFEVHTVSATATVLEAIDVMNDHRVGALVVTDEKGVRGIFTERDVLRRVVAAEKPPSQVRLAEVMTRDVICCDPSTTIEEAARMMKDRRVRHLPVCDEKGGLMGLVSIGDVNAYYVNAHETTINELKEYVYGR